MTLLLQAVSLTAVWLLGVAFGLRLSGCYP
jgi:hypothetical protein